MTRVDKAIQEQLFDPKKVKKSKGKSKKVQSKSKPSKSKRHEGKDHHHSHVKIYDLSAVNKYISGIRNKAKKEYAIHYLKWKQGGEKGEFPRSGNLSLLAEQAVYFTINRLYDPTKSRIPSRWYEAMVRGIKKSSDVRNPYAIVKSIWAKLSPSKRLEIKQREAKGERFHYDLPLPDDRVTKGQGTLRMVKPFKLTEVQVNISPKDYLAALHSGLFQKMKREDGSIALVARCKSQKKNCNIFVDKVGR